MVHYFLLLFDVLLVLTAVLAVVGAYRMRLRAKAEALAEQLVRDQHPRPRPVFQAVERPVKNPEYRQLQKVRVWHPGKERMKHHPVLPVKPFCH